jgi:hypothetical protein
MGGWSPRLRTSNSKSRDLINGKKKSNIAVTFGKMKIAAYILTLLMLFLVVQPLVIECVAATKSPEQQCKIKRCVPAKPACPKEDNKECERSTACNPFASCSQCHFVNASKFLYAPGVGIAENSITSSHDEKVTAGFMNDCWHPPEWRLKS